MYRQRMDARVAGRFGLVVSSERSGTEALGRTRKGKPANPVGCEPARGIGRCCDMPGCEIPIAVGLYAWRRRMRPLQQAGAAGVLAFQSDGGGVEPARRGLGPAIWFLKSLLIVSAPIRATRVIGSIPVLTDAERSPDSGWRRSLRGAGSVGPLTPRDRLASFGRGWALHGSSTLGDATPRLVPEDRSKQPREPKVPNGPPNVVVVHIATRAAAIRARSAWRLVRRHRREHGGRPVRHASTSSRCRTG